MELIDNSPLTVDDVKKIVKDIEREKGVYPCLAGSKEYDKAEREAFKDIPDADFRKAKKFAKDNADRETDRATFQAMEALIHNLNTMHSRAGAQTPFSSINYGTDTSPEGRMVIKNILLAEEAGLGFGETPIFPIHIFKVKEGVNYNKQDPNYDLFKLACKVSAKRLFPNFSFIDAPFNLQNTTSPATPRPRSRTWAAAPASWATSTTRRARSPMAEATCPSPRSTCRASRSTARATSIGSSRTSSASSTSSAANCSTASRSNAKSASRTSPSSWGRACG